MISLLKSIVDIIVSLVQLVIHTITSLMNLFLHIPQYTAFIISAVNLLPAVVLPFCLASVSLFVVYMIIGRPKT